MGSIGLTVGALFGSLAEATGAISGLALSKAHILDILGRNGWDADYRALDDDEFVRLHSSEFGELAGMGVAT